MIVRLLEPLSDGADTATRECDLVYSFVSSLLSSAHTDVFKAFNGTSDHGPDCFAYVVVLKGMIMVFHSSKAMKFVTSRWIFHRLPAREIPRLLCPSQIGRTSFQTLRSSFHSTLLQLHQTHLIIILCIALQCHIHRLHDRRIEQTAIHRVLLPSDRLRGISCIWHVLFARFSRIVLRRAEALGHELSQESPKGRHRNAYNADIDFEDGVYA